MIKSDCTITTHAFTSDGYQTPMLASQATEQDCAAAATASYLDELVVSLQLAAQALQLALRQNRFAVVAL